MSEDLSRAVGRLEALVHVVTDRAEDLLRELRAMAQRVGDQHADHEGRLRAVERRLDAEPSLAARAPVVAPPSLLRELVEHRPGLLLQIIGVLGLALGLGLSSGGPGLAALVTALATPTGVRHASDVQPAP